MTEHVCDRQVVEDTSGVRTCHGGPTLTPLSPHSSPVHKYIVGERSSALADGVGVPL